MPAEVRQQFRVMGGSFPSRNVPKQAAPSERQITEGMPIGKPEFFAG